MSVMLFSDIFMATSLTYLSVALFGFIRAAHANRGTHGIGSMEEDHFIEHVVSGSIGFLGCSIGAIMAVIHLVLQNTGSHVVPISVEIISNIADGLLFVAASMFVHHMIKEETPSHPFYYIHMPRGAHIDKDGRIEVNKTMGED